MSVCATLQRWLNFKVGNRVLNSPKGDQRPENDPRNGLGHEAGDRGAIHNQVRTILHVIDRTSMIDAELLVNRG